MPLASFFGSRDGARTWSPARGAAYGAGIGAVAALWKISWQLRGAGSTGAHLLEVAGAALAFALLCAGAALLRNLIARRLIRPDAG
ncbi:MAG TPA: hypothetical protein VK430_03030 [Xanthobacteraceae bacterium]|nr:hypothetical protein [Xanthobacteraceae bacterium]